MLYAGVIFGNIWILVQLYGDVLSICFCLLQLLTTTLPYLYNAWEFAM